MKESCPREAHIFLLVRLLFLVFVLDIFSNHVFPARYMIDIKCVNIKVGEGKGGEGFSFPSHEKTESWCLHLDRTESTRDKLSYHQRVCT